jgi:hypothetical protein
MECALIITHVPPNNRLLTFALRVPPMLPVVNGTPTFTFGVSQPYT